MKSGAVGLEKEVEMENETYLYEDWSEDYQLQYTPDGTRLKVIFEYNGQNVMKELKKLKRMHGFSGKMKSLDNVDIWDGE